MAYPGRFNGLPAGRGLSGPARSLARARNFGHTPPAGPRRQGLHGFAGTHNVLHSYYTDGLEETGVAWRWQRYDRLRRCTITRTSSARCLPADRPALRRAGRAAVGAVQGIEYEQHRARRPAVLSARVRRAGGGVHGRRPPAADWVSQKILVQDGSNRLYAYRQDFVYGGRKYSRLCLFAVLRLSEFGAGQVYPHEQTFGGPIADRLKLDAGDELPVESDIRAGADCRCTSEWASAPGM